MQMVGYINYDGEAYARGSNLLNSSYNKNRNKTQIDPELYIVLEVFDTGQAKNDSSVFF